MYRRKEQSVLKEEHEAQVKILKQPEHFRHILISLSGDYESSYHLSDILFNRRGERKSRYRVLCDQIGHRVHNYPGIFESVFNMKIVLEDDGKYRYEYVSGSEDLMLLTGYYDPSCSGPTYLMLDAGEREALTAYLDGHKVMWSHDYDWKRWYYKQNQVTGEVTLFSVKILEYSRSYYDVVDLFDHNFSFDPDDCDETDVTPQELLEQQLWPFVPLYIRNYSVKGFL